MGERAILTYQPRLMATEDAAAYLGISTVVAMPPAPTTGDTHE